MTLLLRLCLLIIFALVFGCATTTTEIISIISSPPDARVFIDGEFAGATPLKLTLKKETHQIHLKKDGYVPQSDYISPIHRDPATLTLRLFPLYWIFADDLKYTFKDVYEFKLRPTEGRSPIGQTDEKPSLEKAK